MQGHFVMWLPCLKCWYLTATQHSVTAQKFSTRIFIAMKPQILQHGLCFSGLASRCK